MCGPRPDPVNDSPLPPGNAAAFGRFWLNPRSVRDSHMNRSAAGLGIRDPTAFITSHSGIDLGTRSGVSPCMQL